MFETKNGRIIINARNLELMLIAFPELEDDLKIVKFHGSDRENVIFGLKIGYDALDILTEKLAERGWNIHRNERNIRLALQNAVFALHKQEKLDVIYCDYFEPGFGPQMARDDDDVTYYPSTVLFDLPTSPKSPVPPTGSAIDQLNAKTAEILAARNVGKASA
jgi:hypothetical protein